MRLSNVGRENKGDDSNIKDRKLPQQKTQSFKGEKKKQRNWFRRQFSGKMSKEYDPNSCEYSAAIAAAAFAVKALEELNIQEQKKIIEEHEKSFSRIKRTEDTTQVPDAGKISRRFSAEPSIKKEDVPEKAVPAIATEDTEVPEKDVGPTPSIKKASTADKQPDIPASKKPETVSPKPDLPYTKQPTSPSTNFRRQSSTKPGFEETEADVWEQAEFAKIKERYEKLGIRIGDWENKKKEKAKRKKDRTESELELRRAKALRHYRTEMERIEKIAGRARSQAEENRRNEEFKVKEKANRIRLTGKIPATCLCF